MDAEQSHSPSEAASITLESIRITLDLYRSGKSGIPYPVLRRFAAPILAHYELELESLFDAEASAGNLDDMTLLLDVLEIASAFWDYFSTDAPRQAAALEALKATLLGTEPSREDVQQFNLLRKTLKKTWQKLDPGERTTAASDPSACNAVEAVALPPASLNGTVRYGPDHLDLPDAFALFARPLLETDDLMSNPEALDMAMTRAEAYWDIAHLSEPECQRRLPALCRRLATPDEPASRIESEARQMIARFHELFPERK